MVHLYLKKLQLLKFIGHMFVCVHASLLNAYDMSRFALYSSSVYSPRSYTVYTNTCKYVTFT